MKKLIGLVVILAALVLGGYYGMGLVTERTLRRNVDVINQSNGLFVDIEQYDRGWFTSSALLNWRLHIPERIVKDSSGQSTTVPARDHKIQMPLTIYHGPIIYTGTGVRFGLGYAHSDLLMPAQYVTKFTNLFTLASTQPKLVLSVFVNYLNNSRLNIGLPTFKLIAKQGGDQFEWYGMDSDFSISSNLKTIDGSVTIDGASFIKNKMKAMLGKVTSDFDLHQTDSGLYLGDASMSLPSLIVSENEQKTLDVEQFAVHSSSDIEGGLFGSTLNVSLDKMTAHGKSYGPALLEMSIKNLDAQVLAAINEQANKMQQGASDSERQQALFTLLPQLPKLFSQGAQFEISKLSLVMSEGPIEGDLLVSLPKGDAGNPFQLLQKVQGHGKLKIPAAVLQDFIVISVKQKLIAQPTAQQVTDQPTDNTTTPPAPDAVAPTAAPDATPTSVDAHATPPQAGTPVDASQPITVADIEQQAQVQTQQKLSTMVQNGLLTLQGKDYVIEVNLQQGQLSINGKPFNPAMMQF
jgi:uncharacterized protein YdgA (DUF945 family)